MPHYQEGINNHLLELLERPLTERCPGLELLFQRCSVRELQEIFPLVIRSVFGTEKSNNLGWGLRTTTQYSLAQFELLIQFFAPTGPIFEMCYRLLNDVIKFEFNIEQIPHKIVNMIETGQYSLFYGDLVNIDPYRRQVVSLSLNAFDYYLLNFVIHATYPLHKIYPIALQVHSESIKTAYFILVGEYLCNFLPSWPHSAILPIRYDLVGPS